MFNHTEIVRESNHENGLDLILVRYLSEKAVIVPDTNCITSAVRKFMLDMPGPSSSQDIGL